MTAQRQDKDTRLEQIIEAQRKQQDKVAGLIMKFAGNRRVSILTNSIYKFNAGELGLPKGMFLVMIPTGEYARIGEPHFILLRRTKITDTPTTDDEVRMTVMAAKRNMDINNAVITGDMKWDAFEASIVGSYRLNEENGQTIKFLRSTPSLGTGRDYTVYTPSAEMLDIIANSVADQNNGYETFSIGKLKISEFGPSIKSSKWPETIVKVSKGDFLKNRTAIFGKTRRGKTNIAKTIALNMVNSTTQVILDQRGEYCNANVQDGGTCLANLIPKSKTKIFSLSERAGKENICPDFYMYPQMAMLRLSSLLRTDRKGTATYQQNMLSVNVPTIEEIEDVEDNGEQTRMIRKIKIFWAILAKAGYQINEDALPHLHVGNHATSSEARGKFALGLRENLLQVVYADHRSDPPIIPPIEHMQRQDTLEQLVNEIEAVMRLYHRLAKRGGPEFDRLFRSAGSGNETFDDDDIRLLDFLCVSGTRSGPSLLAKYHKYHSSGGGHGLTEVLNAVSENKTIFIDLSREDAELVRVTSEEITEAIFDHFLGIFNSNPNDSHSVLIYYEEAQNLFPLQPQYNKVQTIYTKVAKEGGAIGVGMVYITQSPTVVDSDLLGQTDNFFSVAMSNTKDVEKLIELKETFEDHRSDILESVSKGYAMMDVLSNERVIPVQVGHLFASATHNNKDFERGR
jgi:uncharacterized protein DUF87